jgi:hypothetical protein
MGWGGAKGCKGGKGGKGSWGVVQPVFQKGWGKGKGFGKGFGKGKRKIDAEKTAWIGGLPANEPSVERNKALLEHLKQAGNCKFVRIGNSGTGSAVFDSAEEVQTAIATLNGSDFQGSVIEVDVWTKKEA